MFRIKRANRHYLSEAGWLSSYHHFSFGDYYDPENMNYGSLRVFNDDTIQPASGFPLHAHQEMEIITYVIRGSLAHEDSLGNKGLIEPGEVQRMSAGTGILHAEFNASKTADLHLLQMWLTPNQARLPPSWEQKKFSPAERLNTLLRVVSPAKNPARGTLAVHQDASFYVSVLKKGKTIEWKPAEKNRLQYIFVADGELKINGKTIFARDVAMLASEEKIAFTAAEHAHFVMWDLAPVHVK